MEGKKPQEGVGGNLRSWFPHGGGSGGRFCEGYFRRRLRLASARR